MDVPPSTIDHTYSSPPEVDHPHRKPRLKCENCGQECPCYDSANPPAHSDTRSSTSASPSPEVRLPSPPPPYNSTVAAQPTKCGPEGSSPVRKDQAPWQASRRLQYLLKCERLVQEAKRGWQEEWDRRSLPIREMKDREGAEWKASWEASADRWRAREQCYRRGTGLDKVWYGARIFPHALSKGPPLIGKSTKAKLALRSEMKSAYHRKYQALFRELRREYPTEWINFGRPVVAVEADLYGKANTNVTILRDV